MILAPNTLGAFFRSLFHSSCSRTFFYSFSWFRDLEKNLVCCSVQHYFVLCITLTATKIHLFYMWYITRLKSPKLGCAQFWCFWGLRSFEQEILSCDELRFHVPRPLSLSFRLNLTKIVLFKSCVGFFCWGAQCSPGEAFSPFTLSYDESF